MVSEQPALAASKASWSAVQRKAKDEWLELFANDAIIEDPVGKSPLDPEGKGQRGIEAIKNFWDTNIAPINVKIVIDRSCPSGQNDVAHVGRIITTQDNGMTMTVEGVFSYRVNDEGKLISLRAYWDFDEAIKTMQQPS